MSQTLSTTTGDYDVVMDEDYQDECKARLKQITKKRVEWRKARKDLVEELADDELGPKDRKAKEACIEAGDAADAELASEKEVVAKELSGSYDHDGSPQTVGKSPDGDLVGKRIDTAMKGIEKDFPEFHAHLVESLKDRWNDEIRYEPPEPTEWIVEM